MHSIFGFATGVAAVPARPPPEPPTDIERGLSASEVARRLQAYGPNEVPEKKESSVLRFLRKFWGLTPWMLELTALLTWFLGNLGDTYIVLGLLVLNSILGFYQEERASQAIAFLRKQLQVSARVLRDGTWSLVPARELVPGDVVRIRTGDFVPADLRIHEGVLEVDQSAVTGESLAVEKGQNEVVVSGSTITGGEATAVVVATGAKTYFGRTVELVQIAKPRLHMEEVTSKVVQWLLVMVGSLLAVAVAYAAFLGRDVVALLPLAVVLLVSAIPVALPTMFTISMALGSLELAKKGVLITRLSAAEDAATMDVLCADKTGTITVNRLRVVEAVPLGAYTPEDVLRFGALASREANRDPIDVAVLEAARARGVDAQGWTQQAFVPFDPRTRRTAAAIQKDGTKLYSLKGAINAVVAPGSSKEDLARVVKEVERFSAKGYRSLAVGVGPSLDKTTPVGLLAFADPPREDSARHLAELRDLGISVKMLTGDALPIAQELAREVGLGDRVTRIGDVKSALSAGQGVEMIESANGFAEIYPEDKYLVVKALQEHRHVVGMTGDGVNDAPALRQAEVGIAVSNATDVAKKSASVVLTREGLAGSIDLVQSGRMVYQRIITWILNKVVKTFQIVVFVVLAFLLTGQYVVSVFSMILFLFVTDFVTLSLATDTVRYSKTPDNWNVRGLVQVAVALGILIVIESFGLLYLGDRLFGILGSLPRLQTFIFDYLVFLGVLHVMILRERGHFWESRPSLPLLLAVVLDILIVAAMSTVGFFQLSSISPVEILTVLGFSLVTAFLVNDAAKALLVRRLWQWA
ncbi:MAG TPA: plasma-membrane proton-efflux P-type ATPase [Thermoplasmata archaeon]|nr:plasma-membrane proton-efflux P-type ATPase [Thermoplasmata archaeon]